MAAQGQDCEVKKERKSNRFWCFSFWSHHGSPQCSATWQLRGLVSAYAPGSKHCIGATGVIRRRRLKPTGMRAQGMLRSCPLGVCKETEWFPPPIYVCLGFVHGSL